MHVHFLGEPDDGVTVSSHHARALAGAGVSVSFDGQTPPPRGVDVLHVRLDTPEGGRVLRRVALWRLRSAALVRYWSGRDVLWAEHHAPSRRFAHALARMGAVQLTRCQELSDRLARLAIPARVGPLLSLHAQSTCEPEPLPAAFTVLCHLPAPQRVFCGGPLVDQLIRRLPSAKFLILGDTAQRYDGLRHVEPLGVVDDVNRVIQRATAVLQARVDGLPSRLSIEALCHGRHVIATHPAPHVQLAGSLESCVQALRAVGRDAPFNLEGRKYACKEFDRTQAVERLLAVLQEAAAAGAWGGMARGPRAAVASLMLGAGQVPQPGEVEVPADSLAFASLMAREGVASTEPDAAEVPL